MQDHDTDHRGRALGLEGCISSPPHLSARPRAGNRGRRHPRRENRQVRLPSRVPPAGETKRCSCTGRGALREPRSAVPEQSPSWDRDRPGEAALQLKARGTVRLARRQPLEGEHSGQSKCHMQRACGGREQVTRRTQWGWSVRARGRGR